MSDAWYQEWFGREYLALYPHRDEEEARRAVALLDRAVRRLHPPGSSGRVLDLACGAGRHLRELERAGYRTVGLDLSPALLRRAHHAAPGSGLVRADMRAPPFADGAFDVVASFFTSFGYFERPADDRVVLGEVARLVGQGGIFLLDFLNPERVRRTLRPRDESVVDGVPVLQERRLIEGDRRVEKRIVIGDPSRGETREFRERVRLYGREELEGALAAAGLEPALAFGDYEGGPYGPDAERLIVVARAQ